MEKNIKQINVGILDAQILKSNYPSSKTIKKACQLSKSLNKSIKL